MGQNLPPGFGPFPLESCGSYATRMLPRSWRNANDVFLPIHLAEALWLSWNRKEAAIMVGAGGVNAISGEGFQPGELKAEPQSYCTAPQQPWLDGIKSGEGIVRQFVATAKGSGASVEAQVCGQTLLVDCSSLCALRSCRTWSFLLQMHKMHQKWCRQRNHQ